MISVPFGETRFHASVIRPRGTPPNRAKEVLPRESIRGRDQLKCPEARHGMPTKRANLMKNRLTRWNNGTTWYSINYYQKKSYDETPSLFSNNARIGPPFALKVNQSAVRLGSHGRGGCWVETAFSCAFSIPRDSHVSFKKPVGPAISGVSFVVGFFWPPKEGAVGCVALRCANSSERARESNPVMRVTRAPNLARFPRGPVWTGIRLRNSESI